MCVFTAVRRATPLVKVPAPLGTPSSSAGRPSCSVFPPALGVAGPCGVQLCVLLETL